MTTAHHMDCMEYMRGLPDKAFDLCIADPPYFDGPNRRKFYGCEVNKLNIRRVDYPKTESWDIPDADVIREIIRVSKHQIIWGCNYYDFIFGSGRIVWDKVNGDSSFSDCEIAYCSMHDSVRLFPFMWNGMLQGKSESEGRIMQGDKSKNEVRIHQCQKPLALYRWLFQRYWKEGWSVLDPYLGSGSSRIVAHEFSAEFVGIEKERVHFDAQEERFAAHTAQGSMFERAEQDGT